MVLSALLFVHKESGSAEGKNFLWRLSPSLSPSPSLPFSVSLPSHLPRSSLAHTQSHTLARTLTRTRTLVSFPTASTSLLFALASHAAASSCASSVPFLVCLFTRGNKQIYIQASCQARSQAQAAQLGRLFSSQRMFCPCTPNPPAPQPASTPRCPHKTNLKIVADSAGGLENPNETIERTPHISMTAAGPAPGRPRPTCQVLRQACGPIAPRALLQRPCPQLPPLQSSRVPCVPTEVLGGKVRVGPPRRQGNLWWMAVS